jgi:hypothetical protein
MKPRKLIYRLTAMGTRKIRHTRSSEQEYSAGVSVQGSISNDA